MWGRSLLVLLFLLILLIIDLEVSELIRVLRRGDDSQPVPQVVLLQVLLRQVLEVTFAELDLGTDDDLRLVPLDRDGGAQIVRLAIDFDPLVKILLKIIGDHNAVLHRSTAVNRELQGNLLLARLDDLCTLVAAAGLRLFRLRLAVGLLLRRCWLSATSGGGGDFRRCIL